MRVVFFGTPLFSAKVLENLLAHGIDIVGVVTRTDKAKGRSDALIPTPVKQLILDKKLPIPIFQPEKISAPGAADVLAELKADLFVVVAYGEIIRQHVLDMPRLGCINVHTSILPHYRGAAPIQRCIINGETETGVSIMYMVRQMDAGDVIKCVKVPITENMTFGELEDELCRAGSQALLETLPLIEKGIAPRTVQNHEKATLAPKIELEDCEVKWTEDAQKLHNLIRGTNPYPGAWCWVQVRDVKKRLKLIQSKPMKSLSGKPGDILHYSKDGIIIACGKDALKLERVQLEGKKVMSVQELINGLPQEALKFCI